MPNLRHFTELKKRVFPAVVTFSSFFSSPRLYRSKMDGSFDCDCGELEPPDH